MTATDYNTNHRLLQSN